MIEICSREIAILVSDFSQMVEWYKNVLVFKVVKLFDDEFHYCNMETNSGIKIGIGVANEMGVSIDPKTSNSVIMQIEVDSVKELFNHLESKGTEITGGPSYDKNDEYWFGSFVDPEGNSI